jgi:hypothetical protein
VVPVEHTVAVVLQGTECTEPVAAVAVYTADRHTVAGFAVALGTEPVAEPVVVELVLVAEQVHQNRNRPT